MEYITDTLDRVLEQQVARYPDKEFMVYPDRDLRFTYAEFDLRVNRMAKGLLAIGLRKGDHLGIWATNVPDWLTLLFAAAKIGVITVTVNTAYRLHELDYLIKQSDIKALCLIDGFRDSDYLGNVNELVPELKSSERGRLESARFPRLKTVIFIGPEKHRGMYNTQELLLLGAHTSDDTLRAIQSTLSCHEVINMQYTSGTTGFPKGVMLTHHNILNNGFHIGERQKFTERERVCLTVPLFHCFGLVLGMMAIVTHGATAVILESFDPLLALASVQKEKCTAIYGVPTMFIAELSHPMFSMFDLASLRTGIMAGSPCPMEIMKRVIADMKCRDITIAYGLTEGSPVMTQTSTDDPIELRVSTVGQRLPGIEVRIVDPENREVPAGTPGEVVCRGYNVMKGYYNLPDATAQAIDHNGWLHSGDLGTMDAQGYFKITGRIKDMIIRGGENVSPREIEEYLLRLPGIKDVQVAGIASPKYGEEVGAFVIRKDGATITEEDVRDFCRGQIANFKIPKYVFFVDGYPMTASGKIQKYKLRELGVQWLKDAGVEIV
ncbi:MAG TPA: AMP-binding protein [Candidatus Baltobacteraceae bacterium]|nr:AMP-binding protein [Candidatus Baltobacteraceae bacterium]